MGEFPFLFPTEDKPLLPRGGIIHVGYHLSPSSLLALPSKNDDILGKIIEKEEKLNEQVKNYKEIIDNIVGFIIFSFDPYGRSEKLNIAYKCKFYLEQQIALIDSITKYNNRLDIILDTAADDYVIISGVKLHKNEKFIIINNKKINMYVKERGQVGLSIRKEKGVVKLQFNSIEKVNASEFLVGMIIDRNMIELLENKEEVVVILEGIIITDKIKYHKIVEKITTKEININNNIDIINIL